jgi:hypothetical protein
MLVMTLTLGLAGAAIADDCAGTETIAEGEQKFSVTVAKASGLEEQSFNDIGCAIISRNSECATRQGMFDSAAVTYDYQSGEQIPVEKAYFVMKTDVNTPKGFGIVAFKEKAAAEKFSAGHGKGKVVKWFQLIDEKLK